MSYISYPLKNETTEQFRERRKQFYEKVKGVPITDEVMFEIEKEVCQYLEHGTLIPSC